MPPKRIRCVIKALHSPSFGSRLVASLRRDQPMRSETARRRAVPLLGILGILVATSLAACKGGSIASAGTELSTSQAVLDLGQGLIDVREDNAALQAQIDSLRGVVAYQDSVLRQLATLSGVGMR